MDMKDQAFDVAIIGGGPAGSTAASLLATQGTKTAVVEQANFPRFHIGESLLPASLRIFDRLGVRDQVEAIGVHKPGGKWIYGDRPVYGDFAYCGKQASFANNPYAYMVDRSQFDQLMLDTAIGNDAHVFSNTRVKSVIHNDSGRMTGIRCQSSSGAQFTIQARMILDCSGQKY